MDYLIDGKLGQIHGLLVFHAWQTLSLIAVMDNRLRFLSFRDWLCFV